MPTLEVMGATDQARLRSDALHWREIDGELVVLERDGGRYLQMNPSATVLWPLLIEGTTLDRLADALVERFEVDEREARADARDYVTWLGEQGLLASSPD